MSDVKQLKIEEFDLVSFVMQIQAAILQGYEVTDSSDDAPMCIGHCYHVIMREAVKPNVVVGKAVFEASIDTTKLQEQFKAGGEIEQMLADSLVVDEKLHDLSTDIEKDADKWDNKELGADEAYVETTEPPKEPTIDESLPKEERAALQTKQPTKRGRK
jgi:hypothetical protein